MHLALHVGRTADGLGEVRDEDRGQEPGADRLTGRQSDAEHHLLGDPVEECPERQRPAAAHRRHPAGRDEVGEGAHREPDRYREPTRLPHSLLHQLEAHRADQRARTEAEHEPDDLVRPRARSPTAAPITSDDAASAPQPIAAPTA